MLRGLAAWDSEEFGVGECLGKNKSKRGKTLNKNGLGGWRKGPENDYVFLFVWELRNTKLPSNY